MSTVGVQDTERGLCFYAVSLGRKGRLYLGREGLIRAIAEAECLDYQAFIESFLLDLFIQQAKLPLPPKYGLTVTPHLRPKKEAYSYTDDSGAISNESYPSFEEAIDAAMMQFTTKPGM